MLDTILTVASVIVGISGIVIFYLTYKAQGKLYQKEKDERITKERNKLNMPYSLLTELLAYSKEVEQT